MIHNLARPALTWNNVIHRWLTLSIFIFLIIFRAIARKLTYALASAFHDFCQKVKAAEEQDTSSNNNATRRKKFAIDLRTPEELLQSQDDIETEA